jgi:succinate dehydrogenase hydrophobic anchor subunit
LNRHHEGKKKNMEHMVWVMCGGAVLVLLMVFFVGIRFWLRAKRKQIDRLSAAISKLG